MDYIFKGKRIGVIVPDKSRFLMWKKKAQFFNLYKAWSIENKILLDLIRQGIKEIQIHVRNHDGSEVIYKTSPEIWLREAIIDKFRKDQDPTAYMPVHKFERLGL